MPSLIKQLAIGVIACMYTSVYSQLPELPDSVRKAMHLERKDSSTVIALNGLATTYLKSNPSLSRKVAGYAAETAKELKYKRGYARALVVTGNSYWYEGTFEFAQNYYLLAARQYQSIGDRVGLGQVYNNIGEVNKRLGELDEALEYLEKSLELKKHDSTRAITLSNIAEIYITSGDYDQAMKFINESLSLATKANDERVIAYNHWSIGRIMHARKRYNQAETYYQSAIAMWKKLGEIRSLVQTIKDLSNLHRERADLRTARSYLDSAFRLTQQIKVPDLQVNLLLNYSLLDSLDGNYEQSLRSLWRHNQLKDSVYNLLKAEQIARLQTAFESDMQENENQQLRAEKELQEHRIQSREVLLLVVVASLVILVIFAAVLFRQRSKILWVNRKLNEKNLEIHDQKEAIEAQAESLIRLNDALQELNKNLEDRIEQRSRQLVIQNKKLAEYTFINAHKLRAPVARILGLIHLSTLVNGMEREEVLKQLKVCSDELDQIIREISRNLEAAIVADGG